MPRFKPKGTLERSASGDLWKHTLSRIPTVFGRLAYLASLRDANSGAYRHHGLSTMFGREEGTNALRSSHEEAFTEWLGFSLKEKYADLDRYFESLEEPRGAVADHWLRTANYRSCVPGAAKELERELFSKDMENLLEAIKNAAARN
jgi:hypothetical protein